MQLKSDTELLNEYAGHKSEAAFGEIVRRYADFVYSAALRQVGNTELARDVAQTVFIALARKAGSLPSNTVLIGWLCHSARLAALEQQRKDQRRLQRERHAMDLADSTPETADDWQTVRPVLDEAIASLGVEDRDALLLRFFKNESLATVGAALGVSEDAAQKRVSRALGKLREFISGRGITTTAAVLSATLTANAVHAAPAGFTASLATGALTSLTAGSATPFAKLFTFTAMKTSIPLLALTGGLIALTALQVNARKQLHAAQALSAQQAGTIAALRAAAEQPVNPPAELEQLRADARDVLRLRAEVAKLRRDLADSTTQAPKPMNRTSETALIPPTISVRARYISVRAGPDSLNGLPLTDTDTKELMESLKKIDGARFITEGNVLTLSGNQTELQMPAGNQTNAPRFTINFVPSVRPESSDIILECTLTSEALIDLAPGEAHPDGLSQVRSLHSITNALRVPDGQTAILTRSIARDEKWLAADPNVGITEPRELLILLTPTLITPAGERGHPQPHPTAQAATPQAENR